MDLESLLAARAQNRAGTTQISQSLRGITAQAKHENMRARTLWDDWMLSERRRHIAVMLYALNGHDARVAVDWLMCLASQQKWPKHTRDWVKRRVEDLVLATSEEDMDVLTDPGESPQKKILAAAWKIYTVS